MRYRIIIIVALFIMMPIFVFAGEGHEECGLCHPTQASRPSIFVESLKEMFHPTTNQVLIKIVTLCMACHAEEPIGLG